MRQREFLFERLRRMGISEKTIFAVQNVKRENFVLPEYRESAYEDTALPIMAGQTISQPFTVAYMLDLAEFKPGDKVLEIGAGSGYNAAVISRLVGGSGKIYSLDIIDEVIEFAKNNLEKEGVSNVEVIYADGYEGYEKEAQFDKIIVTAAADGIPDKLLEQLKLEGILVIPINIEEGFQTMTKLVKKKDNNIVTEHGSFAFVPFRKLK